MATSFRWVARAGPTSKSLSARPTTATVTAPTAACFHSHRHQRRHSSSKPPVPPNHGSSNIPAASQGSVKSVSPRSKTPSEKRAGSESRLSKRKMKNAANTPGPGDAALNVPSVPPTAYLQPRDVHLASLFSTHRPISITSPIPTSVAEDSFASIFAPRTKKNKNGPSDVIYTLSSAVKVLDNVIQQHQGDPSQSKPNQQVSEAISHMRNALAQGSRSDGQGQQPQVQYFTDLKVALDEVAKTFTPFSPPPVPVPIPDEEYVARQLEEEASSDPSKQSENAQHEYEIVVYRHDPESQGSFGPEFFTSHNSPRYYIDDGNVTHVDIEMPHRNNGISAPQSKRSPKIRAPSAAPIKRYRKRVTTTERIIHAISVKRQRKLKMKKHKYKKLMRKTRNLRRKLDQL